MAHPDSGFYVKDGMEYVSSSTVLGATDELFNEQKLIGLDIWRKKEIEKGNDPYQTLLDGQFRGTALNAEVDLFLGNLKPEEYDMERAMRLNVPGYITFLMPFLKEIKAAGDYIVQPEVFSPYGWAGTPDLIMPYEGLRTILDWKSVRRDPEKKIEDLKPKYRNQFKVNEFQQIGGYAIAWNLTHPRPEWIRQGLIAPCYDWRVPNLHVLTFDELMESGRQFVERFRAYCQIENLTLPRSCSL
jgi:hypothetical protein